MFRYLILLVGMLITLSANADITDYRVYYGDINGDGLSEDIYFHYVPSPGGNSFAIYEAGSNISQRLTLNGRQRNRLGLTRDTDLTIEDVNNDSVDDIKVQPVPGWFGLILGQANIDPNGVYICYDSQINDRDNDSLCDDMEIELLGTDPDLSDTDNDGLSDAAEYLGLVNGVELHTFGVNPLRQDILIEMDYYPDFQLDSEAISMVVDAFANAPTPNPDGSTGINVVFDVDDAIATGDIDPNLEPFMDEFMVLRDAYFTPNREGLFRYALIADRYDSGTSSGYAFDIPGANMLVTLGGFDGGTVQEQAGTLMHELGHLIGLRHGGDENRNYKPNYLSIMNYSYQFRGLRVDGEQGVLDFSRLEIDPVDEADLHERRAMSPTGSTTEAELSQYRVWFPRIGWVRGNANRNLDWNDDAIIEGNIGATDLNANNNSSNVFRRSPNDWSNISIRGDDDMRIIHDGNSAGGAPLYSLSGVYDPADGCMSIHDH